MATNRTSSVSVSDVDPGPASSSGVRKPVARRRHTTADGDEAAAAAATVRRPGRPTGSARGPEQRERLIEAALVLFARQGIVDTTLGAIAREAGVTSAMVHYYFNTRDQLLDVVIDERFLPLRAAIGSAFRDNLDDPVAAITEVARRLVETARAHPWFAPVWVREVISDGGLLKQRMTERFGADHHRASLERIAQWQREGRMNPDLDPALIFLSVLGLTILPFATAKMWHDDPVRRHIGPDEIAKHAIALLVSGLGVRGKN